MIILIVYIYSSQIEKNLGHKIYEESMFENFILIKFNVNHKSQVPEPSTVSSSHTYCVW